MFSVKVNIFFEFFYETIIKESPETKVWIIFVES